MPLIWQTLQSPSKLSLQRIDNTYLDESANLTKWTG
nr:MAG TPA: hypothetical protein [Caudoviricetes sp.]